MVKIRIRKASSPDKQALTDLSMRAKRSNGYDDEFMAACLEELTVDDNALASAEYWLAETNRICGCAALRVDAQTRTGEVEAFFVDPDCQRRGIGNILWEKIYTRAKQQGLETLHLDADPAAIPFYQKLGFVIAGKAPSGSIPGRNLPVMTIALKAG